MSEIQFTQDAIKQATGKAGAVVNDVWMVPVDEIRVYEDCSVCVKDESYQARVREIADSILANGFYRDKPLVGFAARGHDGKDIFYLTDGRTRHEALLLAIEEGAGIKSVPMVTSNTASPLRTHQKGVRNIYISDQEKAIIARFLYRDEATLDRIVRNKEELPKLAQKVLEKRLTGLLDVLSSESLEAAAAGKIDLAAICVEVAQKVAEN